MHTHIMSSAKFMGMNNITLSVSLLQSETSNPLYHQCPVQLYTQTGESAWWCEDTIQIPLYNIICSITVSQSIAGSNVHGWMDVMFKYPHNHHFIGKCASNSCYWMTIHSYQTEIVGKLHTVQSCYYIWRMHYLLYCLLQEEGTHSHLNSCPQQYSQQ